MQKSKSFTIIGLAIFTIANLLLQFYSKELAGYSTYIFKPVLWIGTALLLRAILPGIRNSNKRLRKEIVFCSVVAGISYIMVYLVSGLFVTFGTNPYVTDFSGFLTNVWITGTIFFSREYIRYKLINNVYDKDKFFIGFLVVLSFSILEFNIINFLRSEVNLYDIFEKITSIFLPIFIKNIVFTYIVANDNQTAPLIYETITYAFIWICPIFPKVPWIMVACIDMIIPILFLLYVMYEKTKTQRYKSKSMIEASDPSFVIPVCILVVLGIWFALGIFPIKPVSIATGSMQPIIEIGDIAIIKKCEPQEVEVGDIIEYAYKETTVVHRVIEIDKEFDSYYFTTKGDNNGSKDADVVTESQVIGKYMFRIKYLGYPSIMLKLMRNDIPEGVVN